MKLIFTVVIATIVAFMIYGYEKNESYSNEEFLANFSFYTCFQYAGDKNGLSSLFEKRKINKLPKNIASNFLDGKGGDVWSITSPEGQYSVAYRDDDLCTVFVKRTNVSEYINEVNENIKKLSIKMDWKFNPNSFPDFAGSNTLETFHLIGKNSKSNNNVGVVMSATHAVTGNYQVAFSVTKK